MINSILIIWHRDLLRFWRNKTRMIGSFTFPILWLAVFGIGISATVSLPAPGIKFLDFLFPGVLSQFLIFTAMFGAISILQDREFGFLKEVLVSPAPRIAVAIGKILGGATSAFISIIPVIILGRIVGVHITVKMVLYMLPALALLALALSGLGVAIVARLKSLDSGQYIFQFIMFPLTMLSGAFFPLRNLPGWLSFLTKINPVSYAVDMVRRIVLLQLPGVPESATTILSPTIHGSVPALSTEIIIVVVFTILVTTVAAWGFNRS